MASNRLLMLVAMVLLVGCSEQRDSKSPEELPVESLPGVYSGVFPCDGCPGIASTLWLRSDHRYFFRQRYAADEGRDAFDAYGLGRWSLADEGRAIELSGSGPPRAFTRPDTDTLLMRTASGLEHRLTRDPTAPEFSATVRLKGMVRMLGDSASFTECLTGLVAPVSKGGDFGRFRHQYRSAGRSSEAAFVELDGRFSWSGDGTLKLLTIERFVTIKANGAC